ERIIGYIEEFASKSGGNIENSRKIASIAVGIYRAFDKFNFLVFDPLEEFIIKGACLIYDIGKSVSPEFYYKSSMEIFVNSEIHEIKTKEKLMIALVTRYHTKSIPKYSHKWYTNLKDHDKMIVNKLSGFVRLAFAISKATGFSSQLLYVDSTRDSIEIGIKVEGNVNEIIIDDMDKVLLERMIGLPINIKIY
ncbi:MAG: hypothetical protein ACK4F9_04500, partial [Brevinematia bacterium]